jgi:energy-coupling factor transporter ATP-binding protein EcfA2
MHRIVVVGTTGSGKTTLARALAAALAIPHAEQDAFYHEAHWQPAPPARFLARAEAFTAQPAWVIDGNYALTRDLVWSRADTLLWLDYPAPLVLRQLLARTVRRTLSRELLWNGNREQLLPNLFTADGLIPWFFRTHWRRRRETPALIAAYPRLRVHHLRHPREAAALVTSLSAPA